MEKFQTQFILIPLFLALIFVGVSHSQLTCTRHESLTPVQNFNFSGTLGKWISFKAYASNSEDAFAPGYTCFETTNKYTWGAMIPCTFTDRYLNETGDMVVTENACLLSEVNSAIWIKFAFAIPDVYRTDAVFLHTDYENWAIQYTCSVWDDHMYENIIIWTRTRDPDPARISFLEVLVQNYGFSLDNEIPAGQTNCP